jgi:hypothetical protein
MLGYFYYLKLKIKLKNPPINVLNFRNLIVRSKQQSEIPQMNVLRFKSSRFMRFKKQKTLMTITESSSSNLCGFKSNHIFFSINDTSVKIFHDRSSKAGVPDLGSPTSSDTWYARVRQKMQIY